MWRCVSFDITSIFCRTHSRYIWIFCVWQDIVVRCAWRAGAKEECDEKEIHYVITLASVFIRVVTLVSKFGIERLLPIE